MQLPNCYWLLPKVEFNMYARIRFDIPKVDFLR